MEYVVGEKNTSDKAEVTVIAGESQVEVTNTLKTTDVTVKKTVSGNMGDRSKEFTFTVLVSDAETNGRPVGFNVPEGVTYDAEQKTATFTLHHNTEVTLTNIPIGSFVTVTEIPDGYTATAKLNDQIFTLTQNNTSAEFKITDAAADTIVFNNEKVVDVDTGISLDSIPYILILGVVAVAGFFFLGKRRRED